MGNKKDALDIQQKPQTPVQKILQQISMFKDNEVTDTEVLETARRLTVASADPEYTKELIHIDNGLERLGGIAIQRSAEFMETFIDALMKGSKAAEAKGRHVTPQAGKVAEILHYKCVA